ncbi:hypothetical protein BZG36_04136 [Bifiguratus adelaidae]|uniref:FYVE-type domain-containing protein n=1 Tax=Bifiguratus adelaidae TaxID=1938954 RepID=A0A261XW17_9FUNG|nr:hypothetical protein BZG36_04136 [Bifiguratus adelaidae]
MDVYTLTRKQRPTHVTKAESKVLQESASQSLSETSARAQGPHKPTTTSPVSRNTSAYPSQGSGEVSVVTGPPTRQHWTPDHQVNVCQNPGCQQQFSLFERRHHCRKCGNIFCSRHCSNYIRLNQQAAFHTTGVLSRACDTCAEQYERFANRRKSSTIGQEKKTQTNVEQGRPRTKRNILLGGLQDPMASRTDIGREDIVPAKENARIGINIKADPVQNDVPYTPAKSIPDDWQWSTF